MNPSDEKVLTNLTIKLAESYVYLRYAYERLDHLERMTKVGKPTPSASLRIRMESMPSRADGLEA